MLVVLVYHKVSRSRANDLYTISDKDLFIHLQMVQKSGIPVVDPRALSTGWNRSQPGIMLTFDDGTEDHVDTVRPLLHDFKIPGLFYVSTGKLEESGYMTAAHLGRLSDEGHTIGSHSHSHRRMDRMPAAEVAQELRRSASLIEDIAGERPLFFAPPGGLSSRELVCAAREEGYRLFRTMRWGYNRLFDPMSIEVVPMTDLTGIPFLACALEGRGEWLLKLGFFAKTGWRAAREHWT